MFVYIYNQDPDFNAYVEYMKDKIQCLISEKYVNYCEYMNQREEIFNQQENLQIEKDNLKNTIDYIKYLKENLDSLTATRENLKNTISSKMKELEGSNDK